MRCNLDDDPWAVDGRSVTSRWPRRSASATRIISVEAATQKKAVAGKQHLRDVLTRIQNHPRSSALMRSQTVRADGLSGRPSQALIDRLLASLDDK